MWVRTRTKGIVFAMSIWCHSVGGELVITLVGWQFKEGQNVWDHFLKVGESVRGYELYHDTDHLCEDQPNRGIIADLGP